MRAVGLSDLDRAARAVLAVRRDDWVTTAMRLVEDAHSADKWRKRFGTAHPNGGTGSLYAQAILGPTAASSDCTPDYCAAMTVVLDAIQTWRAR